MHRTRDFFRSQDGEALEGHRFFSGDLGFQTAQGLQWFLHLFDDSAPSDEIQPLSHKTLIDLSLIGSRLPWL